MLFATNQPLTEFPHARAGSLHQQNPLQHPLAHARTHLLDFSFSVPSKETPAEEKDGRGTPRLHTLLEPRDEETPWRMRARSPPRRLQPRKKMEGRPPEPRDEEPPWRMCARIFGISPFSVPSKHNVRPTTLSKHQQGFSIRSVKSSVEGSSVLDSNTARGGSLFPQRTILVSHKEQSFDNERLDMSWMG